MSDWIMQEPGWYTSDAGGLSEEARGKWFFWPKTLGPPKRFGPWDTLRSAKEGAETWMTERARS